MTISTPLSSVTYQGNGSTTAFPYAFPIQNATQLVVTLTDTTQTPVVVTVLAASQYIVTGIGSTTGGTLTLPSALPTGQNLTIARVVAYLQSTSIINQGAFYPDVLEEALDYLTMEVQQLAEQASRMVSVPVGSGLTPSSYLSLVQSASNTASAAAATASGAASSPAVAATYAVSSQIAALSGISTQIAALSPQSAQIANLSTTNINVLASVSTQITALSSVTAPLANLGTVSTQVVALSGLSAQLAALSSVAAQIPPLSALSTQITALSSDLTNINVVAANTSPINAIATDLSNINSDAGAVSVINVVAAQTANLSAVASVSAGVAALSSISVNVSALAGVATQIATLSPMTAQFNALSAETTQINALAGLTAQLTALASVSTNIASLGPTAGSIGANHLVLVNSTGTGFTGVVALTSTQLPPLSAAAIAGLGTLSTQNSVTTTQIQNLGQAAFTTTQITGLASMNIAGLSETVTSTQLGTLTTTEIPGLSAALVPPVVGTIRNGLMSIPAASPTGTFTADEVVIETGLGGTAYKLSNYSQTVNLAITGVGGMDTGMAPVSGFVSLYAIANPTASIPANATNTLQFQFENNLTDSSATNLTLSTSGTISYGTGKVGSYCFSGNGYAYFNGTTAATKFPGNFTIQCWLNVPNYGSGNAWALTTAASGSSTGGITIGIQSSTGYLFAGTPGGAYIVTSTALSQNTWHHVAIVRNGATTTLYLDGSAVGTTTAITGGLMDGKLYIGTGAYGNGWVASGLIDQLEFYQSTLYTTTFTPPTTVPATTTGTKSGILACNVTTSSGSVYSGANMPTGYTASALLTTLPTNASSQFPILYAYNGKVSYPKVNALNITSSVPTTYTSVTLSNSAGQVPPNAISFSGVFGPGASSTTSVSAIASDPNGTDERLINLNTSGGSVLDSFYSGSVPFSDLQIITPQTFYYKSFAASGYPVRVDVNSYRIY